MTDRERLIELLEDVPVNYELCMRMKRHCPTTEKPCYECLVDYLLDNGVTFAKDIDALSKVETNVFDREEVYHNCTVQILHNSVTGEHSIGWWPEDNPPREV